MPETPDHTEEARARDRAYQDYAAELARKSRQLEREGVPPEEAGYRILAEMGQFHDTYRSTLHDARQ